MGRRTSLLIVAFWLSIGLLYLLSIYFDAVRFGSGYELSLRNLLIFESTYGSWALLTLGLLKVLRRPIIERRFVRTALIFAIVYVLWQALFTLFDRTIGWWVSGAPFLENLLVIRATELFFHSVLYIVVFVSCAGLIYYAHSREMELAAAESERKNTRAQLDLITWQLRSLQSQLSPHFLFNALNSLSALARSNQNAELVSALARLGDMLRFALETSERSTITIAEEVDFTRNYVALQRLRFGSRYQFELDRESSCDSQSCPPFILQSLVENAFTHAVDGSDHSVSIRAQVHSRDDVLTFSVTNAPRGEGGSSTHGMGMALKNLKERLQLLYGDQCEVDSEATDTQYTALARIPAQDHG